MRFVFVDLGNVLVDFNPETTVARLCRASGLDGARVQHVLYGESWVQLNMGTIEWSVFEETVKAELGGRVSPDEIRSAWCAALTPNGETASVLASLVGRHPIYLLSNTDPMHFACSRKLVPILESFSGFVLSYAIHKMKPDPSFFRQALYMTGARASDCVFIDDSSENVESATVLGFCSIRYESALLLRRALSTLGLEVSPCSV